MDTHPATRWTQFITPLGGIIAFSCFFLPWVERGAPFMPLIERDGSLTYGMSGVDFFLTKFLARNASLIAVAFIASAVIISLSLYTVIRRTPWKSRVPILISAGIGLSHLLTEYLWHVRVSQLPGVSSYSAQLGFWGTIIGFVVTVIGVFLIRREDVNGAAEVSVEARQPWSIIHAGGMLALVCVFMPWGGISSVLYRSGFSAMSRQPLIMFVFIASMITVGISFYALAREPYWRLRAPVFVSVGIGLGILLSYCANLYIHEIALQNILGRPRSATTEHPIEFGFWGTAIGYVIAAVGVFLISAKSKNKQVAVTEE